MSFRASDGLSTDTRVRLTAYDVREHVSQTATLIGSSVVTLGAVQETDRLRIPLLSPAGTTVGFLTLTVWNLEPEDKGGSTESTPCRSAPETDVTVVCIVLKNKTSFRTFCSLDKRSAILLGGGGGVCL